VDISDTRFCVLVDFAFNVGIEALELHVLKLLNQGEVSQVPAQLLRWTKAGGKELPGLKRAERLSLNVELRNRIKERTCMSILGMTGPVAGNFGGAWTHRRRIIYERLCILCFLHHLFNVLWRVTPIK